MVNFSASLERFKTARVSYYKVIYVLIIQVRWIVKTGWMVLTSKKAVLFFTEFWISFTAETRGKIPGSRFVF